MSEACREASKAEARLEAVWARKAAMGSVLLPVGEWSRSQVRVE